MLEQFGRFFDDGALPLPTGLREVALADGARCYGEVNSGSADKIILVP